MKNFPPSYLLIALLAPDAVSRAHDFWIEPSSPWSQVGSILSLRLRVGDDFPGEPVPRDAARIERFILAAAGGGTPPEKPSEKPPEKPREKPIAGRDGSDPAGLVLLDAPGLHIAGYRSRRSNVELDPRRFRGYLKEEGLDRILALREKRGESEIPGREVFSRCAKALVGCANGAVEGAHVELGGAGRGHGGAGGGAHDRVLGFPLELILEEDPLGSRPGDEVPLKLLYEGKPIAGALVKARRRPEEGETCPTHTRRTDTQGRVKLRFDRPGFWLVSAVHMVEAPKETDADWESFWASLTFTTGTKRP